LAQADCLAKHAVTDPRPQSLLRDHVDGAAKEVLKIHEQTPKIENRPPGFQVHEEVNIAIRRGFTPGSGPENPDADSPVACSKLENLAAFAANKCLHRHDPFLR